MFRPKGTSSRRPRGDAVPRTRQGGRFQHLPPAGGRGRPGRAGDNCAGAATRGGARKDGLPHARWWLAPACAVEARARMRGGGSSGRGAKREGSAHARAVCALPAVSPRPVRPCRRPDWELAVWPRLGHRVADAGRQERSPEGGTGRRAGVPSPRVSSRAGESAGSASRQAQGQTAGRAWGRPAGASCRWVQLLGGVTELSLLQFPP